MCQSCYTLSSTAWSKLAPDSDRAGHLRPETPSRSSTAALWSLEQGVSRSGPAVQPCCLSAPRRRFHCVWPSRLYLVSELVMSGETRAVHEHFETGLSKYRANVWSDVAASACVFVPVGIVNFRWSSVLRLEVRPLAGPYFSSLAGATKAELPPTRAKGRPCTVHRVVLSEPGALAFGALSTQQASCRWLGAPRSARLSASPSRSSCLGSEVHSSCIVIGWMRKFENYKSLAGI